MSHTFQFRKGLYIAILAVIFSLSGCLPENLIYPEMVSSNTFKMPNKWAGRNITSIEVYRMETEPKPSLEPVWVVKATEPVPADKIIFIAGVVPHGFEQTVPGPAEKFIPEEGQQYYIKVEITPMQNNLISVLRPWRASSISGKSITDDVKPYIHKSSMMEFPRYVGLFSRGDVTLYDKTGNDISVSYLQPSLRCVATIYIYPAVDSRNRPVNMQSHLKEIVKTIQQSYKETKIIALGQASLEQNNITYRGVHAAFSMIRDTSQGSIPCFSDLYLFRHGRWFIKYRFTYAQQFRKNVAVEIEQFMKSLTWPYVDFL